MATGRVNKSSVDRLTVALGETFLWDDDLHGFGVKAMASGAKSYLIQYRIGGRGSKVRRLTIGRHGSPWNPTSARAEAERLLLQVRQGTDVAQMKREKARRAHDLAFSAYAPRFVEQCLKERWSKTWRHGEWALRRYAAPVLRDKPMPDITRSDIKAVLEPLRGKTASRRYLYAVLRRMFRWALSEEDIGRSPLEGMEAPPLPKSRERVLADWELRLAYGAAGGLGEPFGPLVRLLILTGQRLKEVAWAQWSELDRAEALLRIPSERAKNGRATDVPLSDLTIAELDTLAGGHEWPRQGLVFTTTGSTPVSGFSKAKRHLDAAMKRIASAEGEGRSIDQWQYHDLRRTFATGMQRLGVRFEVTEAILNHVSGTHCGPQLPYRQYLSMSVRDHASRAA
jgi:integrase